MRRSARESSLVVVPGWGTQPRAPLHSGVKAATGMLVGPVKVEFAGVEKSTWNLNIRRELDPKKITKLGEPMGGAVAPSMSEGSKPPTDEPCWKHTCVAA